MIHYARIFPPAVSPCPCPWSSQQEIATLSPAWVMNLTSISAARGRAQNGVKWSQSKYQPLLGDPGRGRALARRTRSFLPGQRKRPLRPPPPRDGFLTSRNSCTVRPGPASFLVPHTRLLREGFTAGTDARCVPCVAARGTWPGAAETR